MRLADEGSAGAVVAIMTLMMGMRCTELVCCKFRDLDNGGRELWIEEAKTPAGRRRMDQARSRRGGAVLPAGVVGVAAAGALAPACACGAQPCSGITPASSAKPTSAGSHSARGKSASWS